MSYKLLNIKKPEISKEFTLNSESAASYSLVDKFTLRGITREEKSFSESLWTLCNRYRSATAVI